MDTVDQMAKILLKYFYIEREKEHENLEKEAQQNRANMGEHSASVSCRQSHK